MLCRSGRVTSEPEVLPPAEEIQDRFEAAPAEVVREAALQDERHTERSHHRSRAEEPRRSRDERRQRHSSVEREDRHPERGRDRVHHGEASRRDRAGDHHRDRGEDRGRDRLRGRDRDEREIHYSRRDWDSGRERHRDDVNGNGRRPERASLRNDPRGSRIEEEMPVARGRGALKGRPAARERSEAVKVSW